MVDSTASGLCIQLRGAQLLRRFTDDNASVATSCVSFAKSKHAVARVQERNVSQNEIQTCLKHGCAGWAREGKLRISHNGVIVITTAEKRILTAWRTAVPMPRTPPLQHVAIRFARRILKQRSHAFRAWKRFPMPYKQHSRWLLGLRHRCYVDRNDAQILFRAWMMYVDMQHACRVSAILCMNGKAEARALVMQRRCFEEWLVLVFVSHQARRAFRVWLAHAANARSFSCANAQIYNYHKAYDRCDTRRALRHWAYMAKRFRSPSSGQQRWGQRARASTASRRPTRR